MDFTLNNPLPASVNEECVKCAKILNKFAKPEDAKLQELVGMIRKK
jgi:hypothetical protein